MPHHERERIRDLARQILEYATSDRMNERRRLWTEHQSLCSGRPLFHIRNIPLDECLAPGDLVCTDPYLRNLEKSLLRTHYQMQIPDDTIVEPYLVVRAAVISAPGGVYGIPAQLSARPAGGGAASFNPSIVEESDLDRLTVADYAVDEAETTQRWQRLADLVGDILPVAVNREGLLRAIWYQDIATMLAKMRGLEQLMWDVYDRPEWLHRLLHTMQQAILRDLEQTEQAGGLSLINHENQSMPYARGLQPPSADSGPVRANQLWGYMAAQEFTSIGPAMFDEFMFQYQKPILERYALTSYGCCEDLTQKIDILRTLGNLRRIGVAPAADRVRCAEQIGADYVLSWRPDPSRHVARGIDEDFIRSDLRAAFDSFDQNKCTFDITLKDVETVGGDPRVLIRWAQIVGEEVERRYG